MCSRTFSVDLYLTCAGESYILTKVVIDLYRSNDGHHLYGCSGDGTICAISFDDKEFPELAESDATQVVLDEYGYRPVKRASTRPITSAPLTNVNGFGVPHVSTAQVNVLKPRKRESAEQRRRIDPSGSRNQGQPVNEDAFSAAPIQPFASPSTAQASTARMFKDAHAAFANGNVHGDGDVGETPRVGTKRKASLLAEGSPRVPRGRMMATTQPRHTDDISQIRAPRVTVAGPSSTSGGSLPVPNIQSILRAKLRDGDESTYLEARNAADDGGKHKITYSSHGQDRWLDYLPSVVLNSTMTSSFCAAACEDGSVFVYSSAGRQWVILLF